MTDPIPQNTPIGRLNGPPPYRPWYLHSDRDAHGPWGIRCVSGYNCVSGFDGADHRVAGVRRRDDPLAWL